MTAQLVPPQEEKYAIPVGTGDLIEFSKFLIGQRDEACHSCKNGYKSIISKSIGTKVFQVPVICTCVPYVQSQDKDNNLVVVYKGVRELWPSAKRPEVYIQNDLVRKAEFESAKEKIQNARHTAKAHDGVKSGKYTLGVLSASERKELGNDLVKSLAPKFDADKAPAESNETTKFLDKEVIRKVAMRNREGNLIVVDNATALQMMKNKSAVPERPGDGPEINKPAKKTSKKGGKKDKPVETKKNRVAPSTPVVPPVKTSEIPPAPIKRGRGRPAGSKNKPKA